MSLTKAQSPNSILLGSARIEVSTEGIVIDKSKKDWGFKNLFDLGLARGVKIGSAATKISIQADNGDVPIKGVMAKKKTVEFNLLERDLLVLGKLMKGIVEIEIEGAEAKAFKETIKANEFEVAKFWDFAKQNFDLSEPKNIVIKQDTKTLNKNTDYEIKANDKGFYGIVFKAGGAFDKAKKTSLEYEYQGIAAVTMCEGSGGIAQALAMQLTAERIADNGKKIKRIFSFAYGFYDAEDSVSFKSKNDADGAVEVPMKFEFTPHPDMLHDEDLQKKNLYKEKEERA